MAGGSRYAFFCPVPIFCLMCSPICLLYHVIQVFEQKALFSEILAIKSQWGKYV